MYFLFLFLSDFFLVMLFQSLLSWIFFMGSPISQENFVSHVDHIGHFGHVGQHGQLGHIDQNVHVGQVGCDKAVFSKLFVSPALSHVHQTNIRLPDVGHREIRPGLRGEAAQELDGEGEVEGGGGQGQAEHSIRRGFHLRILKEGRRIGYLRKACVFKNFFWSDIA